MNNDIKVLIIEDDPMVSHLNKLYTEKIPGFIVLGEINIDNNMKLDNESLRQTDLLLLDIYLPGKDGLTILKEIRELKYSIDVIIISAAKDVKHINEAMHLGIVDYLIKPFTFERYKKSLLKYKDMFYSFNNKNNLKQKDIDTFMGSNKRTYGSEKINTNNKNSTDTATDKNNYIRELPKGLNDKTLYKITNYLKENGKAVTTKEMAEFVGLSRVTAQRYLKYMAGKNIVEVKREYGTVGRPQHFYRLIQ